MAKYAQRVIIKSAPEFDLQTPYHGTRGWIHKRLKKYPEFWIVITHDGRELIFHESQLSSDDQDDPEDFQEGNRAHTTPL